MSKTEGFATKGARKRSEGVKKWWKNLSPEDKREQGRKIREGHRKRSIVMLEGRECTIEEFEEIVDRVITSGDRERIWELKDVCMQALYYGKHTYPEKMESMKKCFSRLVAALDKIDRGGEV